MRAGSPQAVSRWPCCAVSLRTAWSEHGLGAARARHGRGMTSVNQARPHCVNRMGKTHSKPLAAWHGKGTAWARDAICESALMRPFAVLQLWRIFRLVLPRKRRSTRRKTCPSGTLSSRNVTGTALIMNPDINSDKPAANRLRRGTTGNRL